MEKQFSFLLTYLWYEVMYMELIYIFEGHLVQIGEPFSLQ